MIKRKSYFKNPKQNIADFYLWVNKLENYTGRQYVKNFYPTPLGQCLVWTITNQNDDLPTLIIFPGFRTTPLFFDLQKGLDKLIPHYKIYLVETNGQPNPSDGNSPSIQSDDYGHWAKTLLDAIGINETYIAGASFGGQVCMKLSKVAPEKVKAAFLLNPGGLRNISFAFTNLYYNVLPILSTTRENIRKFLYKIVFCSPNHVLDIEMEDLLIDYQMLALSQYKDNTEKPYYMGKDLMNVKSDMHLILGENDRLMPPQQSIANAKKYLPNVKAIHLLKQTGHGIETSNEALDIIKQHVCKS
jgi:pimeloyl-ACP methyl ester carboxylesterase